MGARVIPLGVTPAQASGGQPGGLILGECLQTFNRRITPFSVSRMSAVIKRIAQIATGSSDFVLRVSPPWPELVVDCKPARPQLAECLQWLKQAPVLNQSTALADLSRG